MAENLHFEEVFGAPIGEVFAYFANPDKLGRLWGGKWKRVSPSAGPNPDGLGAVRQINAGAFKWQEQITVFEPGRLIEYQITSGAPVKGHNARIAFASAANGTRVTYDISFDPKIPLTGVMFAATMRLAWTVGVPKAMRDLQGT